MAEFLIRLDQHPCESCCGICGRNAVSGIGPHIYRAEDHAPVCQNCGRRHAPDLAALLDLAEVAKRVGRISQHNNLWLPLSALLEMTRASQNYYTRLTVGERTARSVTLTMRSTGIRKLPST
jgi:hypothetical protein